MTSIFNNKNIINDYFNNPICENITKEQKIQREFNSFEEFIANGGDFGKNINKSTERNKRKDAINKSSKKIQSNTKQSIVIEPKPQIVYDDIPNNLLVEEIKKINYKIDKLSKRIKYLENNRDYKKYKDMYNLIIDCNKIICDHSKQLFFINFKINSLSNFFKKLFDKNLKDKK